MSFPTAIAPELYRLLSKPLQIFECYLESPYAAPSHRYVRNNKDITFAGNEYIALAIKRTPIRSEEGTIINEIEIGLDNVDLEFKTLIASGFFNRKRIDVKLIFDGFLDDADNYKLLITGFLDEPKGDDEWCTMTITPFPMLDREYPKRIFQVGCNWTFGDSYCGVTKANYLDSKTVAGGATTTVIPFVDDSNPDNYYVPGYIEFTSGDLDGESRPVAESDSTSITLRIPLSAIPEVGDGFDVQKLCAKNVTVCDSEFSNSDNYGGFPYVPKQPKI